MRTPDGNLVNRLDYSEIRPGLDLLKPVWNQLISGHKGFFLEDKGWTLAIHARFVEDQAAEKILKSARQTAVKSIDRNIFLILGGEKFLEVGPKAANKGASIEYLMNRYPLEGALITYIGDDDKDEEAFAVINQHKGIAVVVSETERDTYASLRLNDPESVRS